MKEALTREEKKKKWENFWYYYKYHVLAIVFVGFFLVTFIKDMMSKIEYDYQIAWLGKYSLSEEHKEAMQKWFEEHGEDLNEDGEIHVCVVDYFLPEEGDISFDPQIYAANQTKFMVDVQEGTSMIYFVNESNHEKLEKMDVFPGKEEMVQVKDCAGFQDLGSPAYLKDMMVTMRLFGKNQDEEIQTSYEKNQKLLNQFTGK